MQGVELVLEVGVELGVVFQDPLLEFAGLTEEGLSDEDGVFESFIADEGAEVDLYGSVAKEAAVVADVGVEVFKAAMTALDDEVEERV